MIRVAASPHCWPGRRVPARAPPIRRRRSLTALHGQLGLTWNDDQALTLSTIHKGAVEMSTRGAGHVDEVAGALIEAIGSTDLDARLLAIADGLIGVDEIFAYAHSLGHAPNLILSRARSGQASTWPALYLDRFYRLDPLLTQMSPTGPEYVILQVSAWDIVDADYRRECFDKPRFAEKLSYAARTGDSWTVLSLYRRYDRQTVDAQALAAFSALALPVLRKHAELTAEARLPPIVRLLARLQRRHPELSIRENEVCVRTLLGQTAIDIGDHLGIQPSTVLTYRRRAYERIGVSSAAQLVAGLLG